MNTDDYFDCPKLKARLKISSCHKYITESQEKGSAGKIPKFSMPCAMCKDSEVYHKIVISNEKYEAEVLDALGGIAGLQGYAELRSTELYEQRRLNAISNESYWKF